MQECAEQFAHVMLFQCPTCGFALSLALVRDEGNIEQIDGSSYAFRCSCGWSGDLLGLSAKRHWAEPWRRSRRTHISAEQKTYFADQI